MPERERERESSACIPFTILQKVCRSISFFSVPQMFVQLTQKSVLIPVFANKSQMCPDVIDICRVITTHMHLFLTFFLVVNCKICSLLQRIARSRDRCFFTVDYRVFILFSGVIVYRLIVLLYHNNIF